MDVGVTFVLSWQAFCRGILFRIVFYFAFWESNLWGNDRNNEVFEILTSPSFEIVLLDMVFAICGSGNFWGSGLHMGLWLSILGWGRWWSAIVWNFELEFWTVIFLWWMWGLHLSWAGRLSPEEYCSKLSSTYLLRFQSLRIRCKINAPRCLLHQHLKCVSEIWCLLLVVLEMGFLRFWLFS